ncbi:hypothetical protein SISNIDRAFT_300779 [Sistotremastrum niveocremeum HHB9708]|uniref:F-box domain-containing protein n=2 Tax=Sistotremastraceae TaxID=3402574 RepID=A0A164NA46_9AGAM|nr:hypothetical protein SISNIDRAFT_300779 [Sistotremastrum niveocremeum HHB9708]KZT38142.1 hypothetical protein SISSUDRAFT_782139 [Sistotremastrum suecicum HHB10207 ss-3]
MLHTRAAEYVETLRITDYGFALERLTDNDDRLSTSFSHTLPYHRMTRLRTLTTWFFNFPPTYKMDEILFFKELNQSLPPNILLEFWTSKEIATGDCMFLCRQKQLRHLTASNIPDGFLRDPSFLPELADLELSHSDAEQLLHLLQMRAFRAFTVTFRRSDLDLPFCGNSLIMLDMRFQSISPSDRILFLDRRAVDCPNIVYLFLELPESEVGPLSNLNTLDSEDWLSPVITAFRKVAKTAGSAGDELHNDSSGYS